MVDFQPIASVIYRLSLSTVYSFITSGLAPAVTLNASQIIFQWTIILTRINIIRSIFGLEVRADHSKDIQTVYYPIQYSLKVLLITQRPKGLAAPLQDSVMFTVTKRCFKRNQ